jgi:hypothetical protein
VAVNPAHSKLEHFDLTADRPRPLKRRHVEVDDEDDEIEYCGGLFPANGKVIIGTKRARKHRSAYVQEEDEEEEDEEEDEPMREVRQAQQPDYQNRQGCAHCGCICQVVGSAPRGSGSGSQVLAPRVLGVLMRKCRQRGRLRDQLNSRCYARC